MTELIANVIALLMLIVVLISFCLKPMSTSLVVNYFADRINRSLLLRMWNVPLCELNDGLGIACCPWMQNSGFICEIKILMF